MKYKRITAVLLSALITASAVSIPASAQTVQTDDTPDIVMQEQSEEQKSVPNISGSEAPQTSGDPDSDSDIFNGFTYSYDSQDDTTTITGYVGEQAEIVIPSMINDSDVVAISDCAFLGNTVITSVTLPSTLTTIGRRAFECCTNLTTVNFSPRLEKVEVAAFSGCIALTAANLPDTVTTIGSWAFEDCKSITSFHYPKKWTTVERLPSYEDYYGGLNDTHHDDRYYGSIFNNCELLSTINLPNNLTAIPAYAFKDSNYLTSITIPSTVETIGDEAFSTCPKVTSVTIPESVITLGDCAFYNCVKLNAVTIEGSDRRIDSLTVGVLSFANCSSLKSVTISGSIQSIGDRAFECCGNLKSIQFNGRLKTIGVGAFSGCLSLTAANLPDSVTSIGSWAFEDCISLTSFHYPKNWTTVECLPSFEEYHGGLNNTYHDDQYYGSIFNNCELLSTINLPNNLTAIPAYAFKDSNYLSGINLPSTLKTIGNEAFSTCPLFTSVTIPESVVTLGDDAFYNCNKINSVTILGSNRKINLLTVGASAFRNCTSLKNVTISGSIQSIGDRAFECCGNLKSIQFNGGLKTIGVGAFSGCLSLTAANLPDSVTSIGSWAFEDCISLTSFHYPKNWTTVECLPSYEDYYGGLNNTKHDDEYCGGIFNNCEWLTTISIPNDVTNIPKYAFRDSNYLETVELPSTLENIDNYSFKNCAVLTGISLPESVVRIGVEAFSYCPQITNVSASVQSIEKRAFECCSNLKNIQFSNRLETIGVGAFSGCANLTSANLPNSVTSIGSWAFEDCYSLTNFHYPKNWTTVECLPSNKDYYGGLNNTYHDDRYYGSIFNNCLELTTVTIPYGVTAVPNCAFKDSNYLETVYVPTTVITIGNGAFDDCPNLNTVQKDVIEVSSIELDKTELNLNVGSTAALIATVAPENAVDKTITWKSTDETVATVSSTGFVTAVGVGTANITATSANNYSAVCTVKVTESSLENKSVCSSTITLGDTINITANAAGGTAPYTYEYYFKQASKTEWSKKNVENNVTSTTVKPGAAVPYNIKVVITDAAGAKAEKTFNVTVNPAADPLSNTSTCSGSITLGSTINITGKATGGTAPYKYEYYFKQTSKTDWSKKNVADTVTSTTVKPGSAVPYNVKVVITDAAGAKSEKTFNVTVNPAADPLSNTSICSSSITLGNTINITGKATGGTSPYKFEYYYKKSSQTEWTKKSVSDTTTSTTIKPGAAVPYNIKVVVTDSAGKKEEKVFNVTVNPAASPLENTSTATTTITLGNNINITGSAKGGAAPYKFAYYFKKASQTSWSKKDVSDTTTSTTIKPGAAVPYNIKVVVTDSTGKKEEKVFNVTVNPAAAALENTSSATAAVTLGNTINITGSAKGGTAPYKYAYYFKKASQTSWSKKDVSDTTTSTTVKPGAAVPYNIKVVVTDSTGKTAEKVFDVTVNAAAATLTNTSTVSSTITLGNTINIKGSATGGTAPYTYSYYFKKASSDDWTTKAEDTSETSITIKPGTATTYNIMIIVKDSSGKISLKTYNVTVNPANTPLKNTSTVSSSVTLGNTINIKGSATGGTAPYTYSYYFKKASSDDWTTKAEDTTETSITIKPGTATTYNIMVIVKDSTGKSVFKTYDVSVNK